MKLGISKGLLSATNTGFKFIGGSILQTIGLSLVANTIADRILATKRESEMKKEAERIQKESRKIMDDLMSSINVDIDDHIDVEVEETK